MHINSYTEFQLGFSKFLFFNGQYGQDGGTASLCQISSKSLERWPRYGVFGFFKMAAAAILDFKNFKFLMVGTVRSFKMLHRAKFRRNRSNRGRDMRV